MAEPAIDLDRAAAVLGGLRVAIRALLEAQDLLAVDACDADADVRRGSAEEDVLEALAEEWVAFVRRRRPAGACRECGCTESYACDGGCSWVEPDLCSACSEGSEP